MANWRRPRVLRRRPKLLVALTVVAALGVLTAGSLVAVTRYAAVPGITGCRFVPDTKRRIDCASRRIAALIKARGVKSAAATVNREFASYPQLDFICHPAVHLAAHMVYNDDVDRDFLKSRDSSRMGCFGAPYRHGILEIALKRGDANDIRRMSTFCYDSAPRDRTDCYHGVGHGLNLRLGLARSLTECKRAFADYRMAAAECYGGSFMQYTVTHGAGETISDKPFGPCDAAEPGDMSQSCYFLTGYRALKFGLSVNTIGQLCQGLKLRLDAGACYAGVGWIIGYASPLSARVPDECGEMNAGPPVEYCLRGTLALRFLDRYRFPRGADRLCDRFRGKKQLNCAAAVGATLTYARQAGVPHKGSHCVTWFADDLRAACLRGMEIDPRSIVQILDHRIR